MKTTKQRLLNIIVASSITINVVMLGGLGCIATIDNKSDRLFTAMSSPVLVVVSQTAESPAAENTTGLSSSK